MERKSIGKIKKNPNGEGILKSNKYQATIEDNYNLQKYVRVIDE